MKNNSIGLAIISLLIVTVLAGMHRGSSSTLTVGQNSSNIPLKADSKLHPSLQTVVADLNHRMIEFENTLSRESLKISRLDQDPDRTERELELWANTLSKEQLRFLMVKTLDTHADGDERSLAVYLLGLSRDPDAVTILGEIAGTPSPRDLDPRLQTLEESLRASPIDGIIHSQNKEQARSILKEVSSSTNSSFVSDRAQRGLSYLAGNAEEPAIQESKALKKQLKITR
jgi:hypothetical protein